MELINLLEIKTDRGYRHFKLYHGDITKLDFPVDVLCVSAFKNSYIPTPNSLIGGLYRNRGIDLQTLARNPALDLRNIEHSFITQDINDERIGRILCLEMIGSGHLTLEDALNGLLATLYKAELRGLTITSLMLPLLGTGDQGIDPGSVISILVRKMEYLLTTSREIREVILVDRDQDRAEQLNKAMNTLLGRKPIIFQLDSIKSLVILNIKKLETEYKHLLSDKAIQDVFREIYRTSIDPTKLSIELRVMSEYMLNRLFTEVRGKNLVDKIRHLESQEIAPWMTSYFHLIRVFGNAHAHDETKRRIDHDLIESDLLIILFGLERIVQFFVEQLEGRKPKRVGK